MIRNQVFRRLAVIGMAAGAAAYAAPVSADERAFTFTYEATTMTKGALEYEQWATWGTDKEEDADFDSFDFRHELEFGVSDDFQLSLYYDWNYEDGASVEDDGSDFSDVALEGIYNLSSPVSDVVGSALYGEVKVGEEFVEVEGKLILQKNFGPWIVAWNGIIEAEWEEDDYHEDEGELGQTLGVSYQVHPSLTFGAELIHEVEYEDWEEFGENVVYAGPNASYRTKDWWFTVTPVVQLTDVGEEPDFQTRLIFGVNF